MKGKEARGMIRKYKGNWTGRRKGLRIVNKGEYEEIIRIRMGKSLREEKAG